MSAFLNQQASSHKFFDIWLCDYELAKHNKLFRQHANATLAFMNEEEKKRFFRFRFDKDKHQFGVTRVMIRKLLSHYASNYFDTTLDASNWQFITNKYNRPALAPTHQLPLFFNISHCHGVIALILSNHNQYCGIDVEYKERDSEIRQIFHRYFSKKENNAIPA